MRSDPLPPIPILLRALRAILRTLKPNAGSHRISTAPFIRRLTARVADDRVLTSTPGSFLIEADLDDYNGRKLYLFGTNDWKINRTVNALLFEQDIFLDIGANYGTVGFGAIDQVGSAGEVHLFEPQPDLAERLAAAMDRRGTPNVYLHRLALGEVDGELPLVVPTGHSGKGSLAASKSMTGERFMVPVRAAGALVASLTGPRPFGVKVDAEGADLEIIRSVAPAANCQFIVFEGGADRQEICQHLMDLGFAVFGISRSLLSPSVVALGQPADCMKYHDAAAIRLYDHSAGQAGMVGPGGKMSLARFRYLARAQRERAPTGVLPAGETRP